MGDRRRRPPSAPQAFSHFLPISSPIARRRCHAMPPPPPHRGPTQIQSLSTCPPSTPLRLGPHRHPTHDQIHAPRPSPLAAHPKCQHRSVLGFASPKITRSLYSIARATSTSAPAHMHTYTHPAICICPSLGRINPHLRPRPSARPYPDLSPTPNTDVRIRSSGVPPPRCGCYPREPFFSSSPVPLLPSPSRCGALGVGIGVGVGLGPGPGRRSTAHTPAPQHAETEAETETIKKSRN